MARMPGKYSPPNGALFLARLQPTNEAVGCVGLRPLTEPGGIGIGIAEMKRLYVDPAGRGMGVGRKLADAVVAEARRLGYEAVLLDTLPHMLSAIGLYKSLGFVEVEPYYATPLEGTVFLRLDLKSGLGE
ncbi:hypothetical protein DOTSEDRAFT_67250 [Lecanosticta acicola]|uniref:N-acetyltransferase domain-containing protein n=1 Tax=Lecanosticta acicola TaxID=111012 RepID=A0AAI8Z2N0_9PEZI|nr:hypothetical protein DOTSEDRAFT_67250 [Lecanosticta acicola]